MGVKQGPWDTDPTLERDLKWALVALVAGMVLGLVLMLVFRQFELAGVFLLICAMGAGGFAGIRIGKALNPGAPASHWRFSMALALLLGALAVVYFVVRFD